MSLRDEMGSPNDPYSRLNIGEVRGSHRAIAPISEYEASGRFRGDPDAVPDPARVADLALQVVAIRESREPSPVSDQLEAAYRLAECFSPGHAFLRSPINPDVTLGIDMACIVAGHRKPKNDPSYDVAQQVESPLHTSATVLGSTWDGFVHTRVFTVDEVHDAARGLLPTVRARSWCGFCFVKRIRPVDAAILLRGHSFWIDARPACLRCQAKLEASAARIGVELDWVRPASAGSAAGTDGV